MYEDHLEAAYWSVVKDLTPDTLPISVLENARSEFLGQLGSGSAAAGKVLCKYLKGVEWDWPAWWSFAKLEGYDTLACIAKTVEKMRPSDLLSTAGKSELILLCRQHGVHVSSASTKLIIIKALSGNSADIQSISAPLSARLFAKLQAKCRDRMAMYIAMRVSAIAYNADRYEQLSDPEFIALRPNWRFIWANDYGTPKACKKFDNKVLPVVEARHLFPHLPCEYLNCRCRLVPVDGASQGV